MQRSCGCARRSTAGRCVRFAACRVLRSPSGTCRWAAPGRRPSPRGSRATTWPAAAGPASCYAGLAETKRSCIGIWCRKRSWWRGRLAERWPRTPVCVAGLTLDCLEGMQSGTRHGLERLAGRRVLAAAGIADPESLAVQLRATGADVRLLAYQDHHRYADDDLARLVRGAARADYVVITEKDAVKLRGRWPGGAPEPLIAGLAVPWEPNRAAAEQ